MEQDNDNMLKMCITQAYDKLCKGELYTAYGLKEASLQYFCLPLPDPIKPSAPFHRFLRAASELNHAENVKLDKAQFRSACKKRLEFLMQHRSDCLVLISDILLLRQKLPGELLHDLKDNQAPKNDKVDPCCNDPMVIPTSCVSEPPQVKVHPTITSTNKSNRQLDQLCSPQKRKKVWHSQNRQETTQKVCTKTIESNIACSTDALVASSPPNADHNGVLVKQKPKTKPFHLRDFLAPKKTQPQVAQVIPRAASDLTPTPVATLPSWMTSQPSGNSPTDDPRAFGHEFILQAAGSLPSLRINVDGFAWEVENAIYNYATDAATLEPSFDWITVYWRRVHLLAAAICGKHDKSTLKDHLLDGKYLQPSEIVNLTESELCQAFLNKPKRKV